MKYLISLLLVSGWLLSHSLLAQSIGINANGNNPDPSAMLDVQSTTQGMLVPRMDSTQRKVISNPATGLLVFDTDTESFWFHATSGWTELVADAPSRLADADGNTQIQVEETPNDNTIRFDVDGSEAMVLTPNGELTLKGSNSNDPGFMALLNGDSTRFLRLFSGTSSAPDPFINWEEGTNLRFVTTNFPFSTFVERMRLTSDGQLGIGTQLPQAGLHLENQQMLMRGNFVPNYSGAIPDSGAGTRLMWVPEKAAFRVGRVGGTEWDLDSIGDYSTVSGGVDNKALEPYAFVGGGENNIAKAYSFLGGGSVNRALGDYSAVVGGEANVSAGNFTFMGGGQENTAPSSFAVVVGGAFNHASGAFGFVGGGESDTASGDYSFVGGGIGNTAPSKSEAVLGQYAETYTPNSATSFDADDRLLVIGNGADNNNRSNALTLIKNGDLGLGTSTPQAQLHVEDGQVLMRGDFVTNYSGAIPDSGSGTRMMWIPEKAAFRVGGAFLDEWDLDSIGDYSTVVGGLNNTASGSRSFVGGGSSNRAQGEYSAVVGGSKHEAIGNASFVGGGGITNQIGIITGFVGNRITADGYSSFIAGGSSNFISGNNSFIGGGYYNIARGRYSFSGGGTRNTAASYCEAVFGMYAEEYPTGNIPNLSSFEADDRLFVIGNGTSTSNRTNALTILKNGNVGIGSSNPQSLLHVEDGQVLMRGNYVPNYSGPIPVSGGGTRLMWIPEKAAFRVGRVSGTEWDLDSIGNSSTVVGGVNNTASGSLSFVGGGDFNVALGVASFVAGGRQNEAGNSSFTGGGTANKAQGVLSAVVGGSQHRARALASFIGGGGFISVIGGTVFPGSNEVTADGYSSFIAGGSNNLISGNNSFIGGGTSNTAAGRFSFNGGGLGNTSASYCEAVFGMYAEAYPTGNTPNLNSVEADDRLFVIGNGTSSARSNALTILKNGNVGIGESNPTRAKLEIDGANNFTLGTFGFLNVGGLTGIGPPAGSYPYSIYTSGAVASFEFHAFSDARIKDIQGISDGRADLHTLMQIEITDYRMKDTITSGTDITKKVIAQQVAEVYPQAVSRNLTDVVPDIYQRAEVQDGWIMLATDLQVGERVKLITEQSAEVYEVSAVETDRFQVSGLGSQFSAPDSSSSLASRSEAISPLFVYGREVNDFHTVDYEAISMLNVSATQAQQQLIEQQQAEIEALEAEVEQLRSLQDRILRIEASLNQ